MKRQLCEQCESAKQVGWHHEWMGQLCVACAKELAEVKRAKGHKHIVREEIAEPVSQQEPTLRRR